MIIAGKLYNAVYNTVEYNNCNDINENKLIKYLEDDKNKYKYFIQIIKYIKNTKYNYIPNFLDYYLDNDPFNKSNVLMLFLIFEFFNVNLSNFNKKNKFPKIKEYINFISNIKKYNISSYNNNTNFFYKSEIDIKYMLKNRKYTEKEIEDHKLIEKKIENKELFEDEINYNVLININNIIIDTISVDKYIIKNEYQLEEKTIKDYDLLYIYLYILTFFDIKIEKFINTKNFKIFLSNLDNVKTIYNNYTISIFEYLQNICIENKSYIYIDKHRINTTFLDQFETTFLQTNMNDNKMLIYLNINNIKTFIIQRINIIKKLIKNKDIPYLYINIPFDFYYIQFLLIQLYNNNNLKSNTQIYSYDIIKKIVIYDINPINYTPVIMDNTSLENITNFKNVKNTFNKAKESILYNSIIIFKDAASNFLKGSISYIYNNLNYIGFYVYIIDIININMYNIYSEQIEEIYDIANNSFKIYQYFYNYKNIDYDAYTDIDIDIDIKYMDIINSKVDDIINYYNKIKTIYDNIIYDNDNIYKIITIFSDIAIDIIKEISELVIEDINESDDESFNESNNESNNDLDSFNHIKIKAGLSTMIVIDNKKIIDDIYDKSDNDNITEIIPYLDIVIFNSINSVIFYKDIKYYYNKIINTKDQKDINLIHDTVFNKNNKYYITTNQIKDIIDLTTTDDEYKLKYLILYYDLDKITNIIINYNLDKLFEEIAIPIEKINTDIIDFLLPDKYL